MVSIGDMRYIDEEAVEEANLLSSMCPQTSASNRFTWLQLEEFGRAAVATYGALYVFAGPAFVANEPGQQVSYMRIGSGVAVPTHFFRVLAAERDGELQVLAFLVPNGVERTTNIAQFITSVDDIEERVTGLDLFADLPDDVESALEARVPELWTVGPMPQ